MINKARSNFLRVVVLLLALSMVSCALKRSALVEADRYRSWLQILRGTWICGATTAPW